MYVIQNSLEFRLPYGSQDICCWQSKMATTKEQETAKHTKKTTTKFITHTHTLAGKNQTIVYETELQSNI